MPRLESKLQTRQLLAYRVAAAVRTIHQILVRPRVVALVEIVLADRRVVDDPLAGPPQHAPLARAHRDRAAQHIVNATLRQLLVGGERDAGKGARERVDVLVRMVAFGEVEAEERAAQLRQEGRHADTHEG